MALGVVGDLGFDELARRVTTARVRLGVSNPSRVFGVAGVSRKDAEQLRDFVANAGR